ncbi:hypothetical protein ED733_003042 [Metarhizium rileyi]|uniref:PPM-type phosphatase domain-containing protein n=1 Tax=Metarhizium rileyi (strain RCEF 4871) TaxID=1649241 RepID=A0A5C6G1D4_METRR|nr:hypothetical protein ED733_003042 [Metarhizium rileyi]
MFRHTETARLMILATPGPGPHASASASASFPIPLQHQDILVVISAPKGLACNDRIEIWRLDRRSAASFTFDGNAGIGSVVVRVASNNPVEDELAVQVGKGVGGRNTLYAGVYDRHAHLDARFLDDAKSAAEGASESGPGSAATCAAIAPAVSGSCALLSTYDRTAVAGDSRAVLGSWSDDASNYCAEALSKDQTGFIQGEARRLEKAHPGRLLSIAIIRAFGDHRWKLTQDAVKSLQGSLNGFAPRAKRKSPPCMTAEPELTTRKVSTRAFAMLALDEL